MNKQFEITWHDSGREPQCAPDPAYPTGRDVDFAPNAAQTCKAELPYPAKRCGGYIVDCLTCGIRVGLTTAGRPDDPRSARIPCRIVGGVGLPS